MRARFIRRLQVIPRRSTFARLARTFGCSMFATLKLYFDKPLPPGDKELYIQQHGRHQHNIDCRDWHNAIPTTPCQQNNSCQNANY